MCFVLAFAPSTLFCKVSRADFILALWGSTSARMAVTTEAPLGMIEEKWIAQKDVWFLNWASVFIFSKKSMRQFALMES